MPISDFDKLTTEQEKQAILKAHKMSAEGVMTASQEAKLEELIASGLDQDKMTDLNSMPSASEIDNIVTNGVTQSDLESLTIGGLTTEQTEALEVAHLSKDAIAKIDNSIMYSSIVENYGAIGDGINDDTQAIKDCLSVSGSVIFTKAKYKITDTIHLNSSNISFKSFAKQVELYFVGDFSNAISFSYVEGGVSNIHLENLFINCEELTGSGSAIYEKSGSAIDGLTFKNVKINTLSKHGILFDGNSANTNLNIDSCIFNIKGSQSYGVVLKKLTSKIKVLNSKFDMSDISSFNALAIYASSNDFIIENNDFVGSYHSAVACSPAYNGMISKNTFINPYFVQAGNEGAIEVEWNNAHEGSDLSHTITIKDNIIKSGYTNGIQIVSRHSDGLSPYYIIISGNNITGTTSNGIVLNSFGGLSNSEDIMITHNILHNNIEMAILVNGEIKNCLISNNIFKRNKLGVQIDNSITSSLLSENISIISNIFSTAFTNAVLIKKGGVGLKINNNTFDDVVYSSIDVTSCAENCQINNNTFRGIKNKAIRVTDSGSTAKYMQIQGNTVSKTPHVLAFEVASNYPFITDNIINDIGATSISVIATTGISPSVISNLIDGVLV